jgi:hypothetical protein
MPKSSKVEPSSDKSGSNGGNKKSGAVFQKNFGDFHAVRAVRTRCAPSPNGHYVGMLFELATGESIKVSVPVTHAQEFGGDFDDALKKASEQLALNYDDPAGIA